MKIISIAAVFLFTGMHPLKCQSHNLNLLANYRDSTIIPNSGVYYNDLWGYSSGEREYAIVGASTHTLFIDITNPGMPLLSDKEAGSNSCAWRDFKTYSHYAYGVSDCGGSSLQIFDLSYLPDSVHKVYDSNALIASAHNIFIDTVKARLYAVGTSGSNMKVLDLSVDPGNPQLLKTLNLAAGYIHDLYVNCDTVYCSHGTSGLVIYEMSDLENIDILGSLQSYPGQGYNHSNWVSSNGLMIMADETHGSPLKLIDASDPDLLDVLSTYKSNLLNLPANNSVAHNPYLIDDRMAVISYYHDGVVLLNVVDPSNPFRAGYFDTYPSNTNYNGFEGCWGVYPYLPSGLIIASDIDNGLFILSPSFPLKDCRKNAIVNGEFDNNWEFNASLTLKSGATLNSTALFRLSAGIFTELLPGFQMAQGSELSIELVNNCNN